jgi:hypothetical protein
MMKTVYSANDEDRTGIANRLAAALAREPNIAFAYLYGSFVEADAFHDVDIGVYVSRSRYDVCRGPYPAPCRFRPVSYRCSNPQRCPRVISLPCVDRPTDPYSRRGRPNQPHGTDRPPVSRYGASVEAKYSGSVCRMSVNADLIRARCTEIEESPGDWRV